MFHLENSSTVSRFMFTISHSFFKSIKNRRISCISEASTLSIANQINALCCGNRISKMATIVTKEESTNERSFESGKCQVKIICLGDSAVGKSKLVERFLLEGYKPQQLSTYALQLFRYETRLDNENVLVEFWDTAGQDMFQSMHPSYYHEAHCCILVFDATRKITYKNLTNWLKELREFRPNIPVLCAANKIDANMEATRKSYAFPQKNNLPFYYVSASDGTNVVRLFRDAIQAAVNAKKNPKDVTDQILQELERF